MSAISADMSGAVPSGLHKNAQHIAQKYGYELQQFCSAAVSSLCATIRKANLTERQKLMERLQLEMQDCLVARSRSPVNVTVLLDDFITMKQHRIVPGTDSPLIALGIRIALEEAPKNPAAWRTYCSFFRPSP